MEVGSITTRLFDGDNDAVSSFLFVKEQDYDFLLDCASQLTAAPKYVAVIADTIPSEDRWLLDLYAASLLANGLRYSDLSLDLCFANDAQTRLIREAAMPLCGNTEPNIDFRTISSSLSELAKEVPSGYIQTRRAANFLQAIIDGIVLPVEQMLLYADEEPAFPKTIASHVRSNIKSLESTGKGALADFFRPILIWLREAILLYAHPTPDAIGLRHISSYCIWLGKRELEAGNATLATLLLHRAADLFFQSICESEGILGINAGGRPYYRGSNDKVYLLESIGRLHDGGYLVLTAAQHAIFDELNRKRNISLLGHGSKGAIVASTRQLYEDVIGTIERIAPKDGAVHHGRLSPKWCLDFHVLIGKEGALPTYVKSVAGFAGLMPKVL
jgi:hypothetical protein